MRAPNGDPIPKTAYRLRNARQVVLTAEHLDDERRAAIRDEFGDLPIIEVRDDSEDIPLEPILSLRVDLVRVSDGKRDGCVDLLFEEDDDLLALLVRNNFVEEVIAAFDCRQVEVGYDLYDILPLFEWSGQTITTTGMMEALVQEDLEGEQKP